MNRYEVRPCRELRDTDNDGYFNEGVHQVEVCINPDDAQFWTVYERDEKTKEARAIADCPTEEDATRVKSALYAFADLVAR